jgi:5S rRNA maturation endonuclease (ribonuclease M5)
MPFVDPTTVQEMHSHLTATQRQILRDERCLSDEIIDRYELGITMKFGDPRVTIPVANAAGEFEDVRCWLHPKRRGGKGAKILHWQAGYGGARLFPIDVLEEEELVLVAGELDAMAMISHGIPAITTTAGEATWQDEISAKIAAAGVERITILPDHDETGHRAAEKRAQSLVAQGVDVKVATWPKEREQCHDATDELRQFGVESIRAILDQAEGAESTDEGCQDTEGESSATTRAAALVELACENAELFHDQHVTPYARIRMGDARQIIRCRSAGFRRWLSGLAYVSENCVPGSEMFSAALSVIEAKACLADQYELSNRVAASEGAFWYDMGDGSAYRIDGAGYEHVEEPPILFASYAHQQIQVHPVRGGDLHETLDFIQIPEGTHRPLVLIWSVSALIADMPHPMLVFYGPQGAGKSSASRTLRALVDPSSLATMSFPRDRNELVQKLAHHYVAPFDNIDNLPPALSDMLCRASTGEGFSKRQLYTDDEDVIYSYRRCVILNGINIAATRADLLDRSILVGLSRISPENRKEESYLECAFAKARPRILGAMFEALSKAMRLHPQVKLDSLPRMADFARWGCAIAEAIGYEQKDFLDAYQANIGQQNAEVLEGQPVAAAVMAFMISRKEWKGSPSELLASLESVAEDEKLDVRGKSWPKAPNVLSRRLREVQPNLGDVGIRVEMGISIGHERGIRISRENTVGIVVSPNSIQNNDLRTDDTETLSSDTTEVSSVSKSLVPNNVCDPDDTDDTSRATLADVGGQLGMSPQQYARSGRRELIEFRGKNIQLIADRAVPPESGAIYRVGDLPDLVGRLQGDFQTLNNAMDILDGEIIREGQQTP